MHRNSQNNNYRNYSYLHPSTVTSLRNTYYQYYDSRLHTQLSLYSNTTPIATYTSSCCQQQYQPTTTISDLAEPISVFADLNFPRYRQSNIIPFPSVYIPPNPSRQIAVIDASRAKANATRERLLIDIQRNISEIDKELSSLERRPAIPRYIPPRFSFINKKIHSSNDDNQMWLNKSKRIYKVIPRITNESKKISEHSTSKVTNQTISKSFLGRYHYGPEIGEVEILENDPENSDLKSTTDEIPELSFHKTFSLDQFRREQSDLPQNRALIFVPQYGDNNEIEFNATAEDFHQNNPIDTDIVQSSIVRSSPDFASADKLNIQDFELLIQTAPEPKTEIPSPSAVNPDEFSDKIEADLVSTTFSTFIKHPYPSTEIVTNIQEESSPSQQTIINPASRKNSMGGDTAHFFSYFGNKDDSNETHRSVNPKHFALPTESELITDDIISNNITGQSQASLSEQQLTIENNNKNVKDAQFERSVAATKYIITAVSTLPSS